MNLDGLAQNLEKTLSGQSLSRVLVLGLLLSAGGDSQTGGVGVEWGGLSERTNWK